MSGEIPDFLKGIQLPDGYYDTPNPYKELPIHDVNLLELSRYAKAHDKKILDLTMDEVNLFRVRKGDNT